MTPFNENLTNSIDNINELEEISTKNITELIIKINYLFRLSGGQYV